MPVTITKTLYTIAELSENARERALDEMRGSYDYPFSDEWRDSIGTFADYFGVSIRDWSIGPWQPVDYTLGEYGNENFRGIKLKSFDPDYMPTGWCGDYALWSTFYNEFRRTGNAKYAFEQAIYAGFTGWREDWEESLSDDALIEHCEINNYLFTESGSFYS